jgi:two-component system cell cycle sensor histidine kinase/response regulator CckA
VESSATPAKLQALLDSDELNRAVLDSVPGCVVVVDVEGRIMRANDAAAEFLGLSKTALRERHVADWGSSVIHEDGTPAKVEEFPVARCLMTGQPQGPMVLGVLRPGQPEHMWMLVTAAPLVGSEGGEPLGAAVTFLDVTQNQHARAELRASQERFRLLVEHVNDTILLVDPQGKILYINRVALGYSLEDVVGSHVSEHMPPDSRELALESIQFAFEQGEPREHEVQASDGRWYASNAVPLERKNGAVTTVMIVTVDVTDRRRSEEERQQLAADLARKVEDLGMLAGGIAHDFNNLLVGILGSVELALRGLDSGSDTRPHLEDVRSAGLHAAELTQQLLAYSGRGHLTKAPLDLNDLLTSMRRLLRSNVARPADVRYELELGLPGLEADGTQLRQVVMNLINNAADALGSAGGQVVIRTGLTTRERAEATAAHPRGYELAGELVFVEVEDDGCGMDDSTLRRVFDPFFSTKVRGHGLGMAGVLGIVRSHHGAISIHSTAGEGSRVRVMLPALSGPVEPPRPEPVAELVPSAADGSVLVVDDDPNVRRVTLLALADAGYRVCEATTHEAGREALSPDASPPDVLVWQVRINDPKSVFEEVRTLAPEASLLFLTHGPTRLPPGLGRAATLTKPFGVTQLLDALSGLQRGVASGGGGPGGR